MFSNILQIFPELLYKSPYVHVPMKLSTSPQKFLFPEEKVWQTQVNALYFLSEHRQLGKGDLEFLTFFFLSVT